MSIGAEELSLYVDNERKLYDRTMAIAKSLAVKKARRGYSPSLARKAFRLYLGKPAAKAYVKEFGGGPWNRAFTRDDLDDFAQMYEAWFSAEYKLGNFESLLPAKYQKPATRKKTAAAIEEADKQRNKSIGDLPEEGMRPGGARSRPEKKKRSASKRGKKMVKPHKRTSKKCTLCGRIHDKSSHWSHKNAPKGGRAGGYKKARK